MSVRAKFRVTALTQTAGYNDKPISQVKVEMSPVFCNRSHATEEDKAACESHSYSEATPSGKLEMLITNPAAFEEFKPNDSFYLDFTRAD